MEKGQEASLKRIIIGLIIGLPIGWALLHIETENVLAVKAIMIGGALLITAFTLYVMAHPGRFFPNFPTTEDARLPRIKFIFRLMGIAVVIIFIIFTVITILFSG